jgi:hypothetical protein
MNLKTYRILIKFIYENSGEEQNLMKIFELTLNLETIYFSYSSYNLNNFIFFPQLKGISFYFELSLDHFKSFTLLYHKQIEKIDLQIKSDMSDFINEFSRFEKLKKLIIRIVITDSNIGNANLLNPNEKGLIWIGNN